MYIDQDSLIEGITLVYYKSYGYFIFFHGLTVCLAAYRAWGSLVLECGFSYFYEYAAFFSLMSHKVHCSLLRYIYHEKSFIQTV